MRQNLLIFLFLIAFSAIIAQTKKSPVKNNAPVGSTIIDTPRYIPSLNIPSYAWNIAMDSIGKYFMPIIGKSLTVDQRDYYIVFFNTQIGRMMSLAIDDSIRVGTINYNGQPTSIKSNTSKPGK